MKIIAVDDNSSSALKALIEKLPELNYVYTVSADPMTSIASVFKKEVDEIGD